MQFRIVFAAEIKSCESNQSEIRSSKCLQCKKLAAKCSARSFFPNLTNFYQNLLEARRNSRNFHQDPNILNNHVNDTRIAAASQSLTCPACLASRTRDWISRARMRQFSESDPTRYQNSYQTDYLKRLSTKDPDAK